MKKTILFIDNRRLVRKLFAKKFSHHFNIFTTESLVGAEKITKEIFFDLIVVGDNTNDKKKLNFSRTLKLKQGEKEILKKIQKALS